MQVSAEIRWFWREAPEGLEEWFRAEDVHGSPAGGGDVRRDQYLRDPLQTELGIKRRGKKPGVEVKGLVAKEWGEVAEAPFAGPIELWTKWSTEEIAPTDDRLIVTDKRRWLRKFDTGGPRAEEVRLGADEKPVDGKLPDRGCNVELTEVRLDGGDAWWTLGFEAFGTVESVADSLRSAAVALAARHPPEIGGGTIASYPAWLAEHAPGGS